MATLPSNTSSGVNDTALPTRRGLGALLAAGAALALPASPAIATTVEPEAELTALADELDALDRRAMV